jgi:chromosome segregation ATPase
LKEELTMALEDAAHLNQRVGELEGELKYYQKSVSDFQVTEVKNSEAVSKYMRECRELEDMNRGLSGDNEKLRVVMQRLTAENKNLTNQLEDLRNKSVSLTNKLDSDQLSRRSDMLSLKSLENESSTLKREISSLSSQLSEARGEISKLTLSLNETASEKATLSGRMKSILADMSQLENNLLVEQKNKMELQESLNQLHNLESLPQVVSNLQTNVTKLRGENSQYEIQISNYRRENERVRFYV